MSRGIMDKVRAGLFFAIFNAAGGMPAMVGAQMSDITLPPSREVGVYRVDLQKVLSKHPQAATITSQLQEMTTRESPALTALQQQWQAAKTAGKVEETGRLEKEYAAKNAAIQEQRKSILAPAFNDIQATIDTVTAAEPLGCVIVLDAMLGKFQSGYFHSVGSGLGDLTFAFESYLAKDPAARTQVDIVTPQISVCYKLHFKTLLQSHPGLKEVTEKTKTAQAQAEAKVAELFKELQAIHAEEQQLRKNGGNAEALQTAQARTQKAKTAFEGLKLQIKAKLDEHQAGLMEPLMADIHAAVARLMPKGADYLIVSDHFVPQQFPAFVAHNLNPSDITHHIHMHMIESGVIPKPDLGEVHGMSASPPAAPAAPTAPSAGSKPEVLAKLTSGYWRLALQLGSLGTNSGKVLRFSHLDGKLRVERFRNNYGDEPGRSVDLKATSVSIEPKRVSFDYQEPKDDHPSSLEITLKEEGGFAVTGNLSSMFDYHLTPVAVHTDAGWEEWRQKNPSPDALLEKLGQVSEMWRADGEADHELPSEGFLVWYNAVEVERSYRDDFGPTLRPFILKIKKVPEGIGFIGVFDHLEDTWRPWKAAESVFSREATLHEVLVEGLKSGQFSEADWLDFVKKKRALDNEQGVRKLSQTPLKDGGILRGKSRHVASEDPE